MNEQLLEERIDMTFDNLAQRSIYYFIATMPCFNSVTSDNVTVEEQETAYNFIRGIYKNLYENPELIGLKILPDDYFEHWWRPQREKPRLAIHLHGLMKKINDLMEIIYKIVHLGNSNKDTILLPQFVYEIKPAMIKKLNNINIAVKKDGDVYVALFPNKTLTGLKLLASISAEHSYHCETKIHKRSVYEPLIFSRGIFNPQTPYTAEIFRKITDNKVAFDKLIHYFNENSFIRIDNKEHKPAMNGDIISLDYVKFYGVPEGKIGYSWKSRNFSGIEISYNEFTRSCMKISVHVPFLQEVLENPNKMSGLLQEFLCRHIQCSNCRFCVSRDRTKISPPRFVNIGETACCPIYSFGLIFSYLNDMEIVNGIIELMAFINNLFKERMPIN